MKLGQINFKKVAVALAVLILIYMAKSIFVDPRVARSNEERDTYNQAAKTINGRVTAANKIRAQEDDFKQRLDKVTKRMPGEPDLDTALNAMRQAFATADVQWLAFNPQPLPAAAPPTTPTTKDPAQKSTEAKAATVTVPTTVAPPTADPVAIKASIAIRGQRPNVGRALDNLRGLERLVVVDAVSLNVEGGQLRAALQVRMFIYDAPEPAPLPDPSGETAVASAGSTAP